MSKSFQRRFAAVAPGRTPDFFATEERHPTHIPLDTPAVEAGSWNDLWRWSLRVFGRMTMERERWMSLAWAYGVTYEHHEWGSLREVGSVTVPYSVVNKYLGHHGYTLFNLGRSVTGREKVDSGEIHMPIFAGRMGLKRSEVAPIDERGGYGGLTPDGTEIPRTDDYHQMLLAAIRHLHPYATQISIGDGTRGWYDRYENHKEKP